MGEDAGEKEREMRFLFLVQFWQKVERRRKDWCVGVR